MSSSYQNLLVRHKLPRRCIERTKCLGCRKESYLDPRRRPRHEVQGLKIASNTKRSIQRMKKHNYQKTLVRTVCAASNRVAFIRGAHVVIIAQGIVRL